MRPAFPSFESFHSEGKFRGKRRKDNISMTMRFLQITYLADKYMTTNIQGDSHSETQTFSLLSISADGF